MLRPDERFSHPHLRDVQKTGRPLYEMRDVATPTTFVRYTGTWKGSFEGWMVTPETWSFGKIMRKALPGLENFYLAGQWVEPGGGLPAVALSGRNVIHIICNQEKKQFVIRS
jgi:phytoene dehydrogenase-like protein